jgi:L-alanine-DL-glutamate epimerase-like enolase superfamily enzyme
MKTSAPTIRRIDIWPADIPLTDPFVISQGSMAVTETLYVRVMLEDGHPGYGEIAPFAALTGETRELSLAAAQRLIPCLIGQPIDRYRRLSLTMAAREPQQPAARCGLETALLDACARWLEIPLWALWGGEQVRTRHTDVTLPLLDTARTLALADHWRQRGFKTLKLKVGSHLEREIDLVRELARQHPDVDFIFDANQGFTRDQALRFIRTAADTGCALRLYEQPLARHDLEGMAWLRRQIDVPLAADESVFTGRDALAVVQAGAADVINLKIMKSGVLETLNIIAIARAAGLGLMIGGMVESRVAMACSWSIVLGMGGIEHLDLDTPLLMAIDPFAGGYAYRGPELSVWNTPGLGMEPNEAPSAADPINCNEWPWT